MSLPMLPVTYPLGCHALPLLSLPAGFVMIHCTNRAIVPAPLHAAHGPAVQTILGLILPHVEQSHSLAPPQCQHAHALPLATIDGRLARVPASGTLQTALSASIARVRALLVAIPYPFA
jgi:hypothetical protein